MANGANINDKLTKNSGLLKVTNNKKHGRWDHVNLNNPQDM